MCYTRRKSRVTHAGEPSDFAADRNHSESGHQRRGHTHGLCGLHVDQHRRQQHERRAARHSGGQSDADH